MLRPHLRSTLLPGSLFGILLFFGSALAEEKIPDPGTPPGKQPAQAAQPNASLEAALENLELPGVTINLPKRCVDVASAVCLRDGALELIACTKDTKEHEALIVINALPSHVHTALLLLGAKRGSPAMRKAIDAERSRWIDVPPSGDAVDVFLVFKNDKGEMVEHPIHKFITPYDRESRSDGEPDEDSSFPTHTFLFAGSILHGKGPGPRRYLSDLSGHVITIATFGDELLCLPGVHSHSNDALNWAVDATELPKTGSEITLRLRPQTKPAPESKRALSK